MRGRLYAQLLSIAAREHTAAEAEDVVQEALISAITAGRSDIETPENARWLTGVVRNRARMEARTARRRKGRETAWHAARAPAAKADDTKQDDILSGLPPALRTLAALVLTGHNRREIAYLLHLPDTALRQRISALKRHLASKGLAAPDELTGLNLDLAYGRIRDILLPALLRHGGVFASHDPDGHLFLIKRSQNETPRQ
ncbi:sigma factor [Devosia sp.]|uniref:RNA polymerase sigma factor n=1 Tax=Devosia sp. TaxID=1871048 RepID=UPI001B21005B|nr:sigma factor [Devosia sp.]MBO9588680.1 transcriptional regulator [Devosia sp.]